MNIVVNGEKRQIQAETLSVLLDELGFSGRVATAVNEQFVPIEMRAAHRLAEGDRIEILSPMQGG